MAQKGDLQNRDRDEASDLSGIPLAGLGELSEEIADERGDLDTYHTLPAENTKPDQMRAQIARQQAKDTGLGSPVLDYTVRSVYDSRPVSGRDFNLWFKTTGDGCGNDTYLGLRNCFYVPTGYVAVIRKVQLLFPDTASIQEYSALVQIQVNSATVDPELVTVGGAVGQSTPSQLVGIPVRDPGEIETFIIADERQLVGVLLTDVTDFSAMTNQFIYVGFHGNFLLKTGVPASLQIANIGRRAQSAETSSAADINSIGPSGADLVVRRRRKLPFRDVPILRK